MATGCCRSCGRVVFTVQDLLADPPFSRLDLVSCRNLLIYLGPEAQAKVIALFHFALREGGVLLLGGAETVGNVDGRFEPVAKSQRVFRHIGRSRPGELSFIDDRGREDARLAALRTGARRHPARPRLADLCRSWCLRPTRRRRCYQPQARMPVLARPDRSLPARGAGAPTHDVLAMARRTCGLKLRSASNRPAQDGRASSWRAAALIRERPCRAVQHRRAAGAERGRRPCCWSVSWMGRSGWPVAALLPSGGTQPRRRPARPMACASPSSSVNWRPPGRSCRARPQPGSLRPRSRSAINEEALSVNEEYQSTNEELLTSKEELQSLNEELTALNSQLQETLERQRTTSNDLQNVLYSTDVATLFLDRDLNIRFFTPATRAVQRHPRRRRPPARRTCIPWPPTARCSTDAEAVLRNLTPVERKMETPDGTWFRRRVLPYRTEGRRRRGRGDHLHRHHRAQAAPQRRWRWPSGARRRPTSPSPASSPRPATICASHCRR